MSKQANLRMFSKHVANGIVESLKETKTKMSDDEIVFVADTIYEELDALKDKSWWKGK